MLLGNGRLARIGLILFISIGVIGVLLSLQGKSGLVEAKKALKDVEETRQAGATAYNDALKQAQKDAGMSGLIAADTHEKKSEGK
ncbi:MAG: hypothetical protein JWQ71_1934 [Pedosphaera sp.]|nr:hypothetical protein [Pedosphaera sp.]